MNAIFKEGILHLIYKNGWMYSLQGKIPSDRIYNNLDVAHHDYAKALSRMSSKETPHCGGGPKFLSTKARDRSLHLKTIGWEKC